MDSVIETCSLALCLHEMGWDQVTYLVIEEYCTDFSWESLGLLLWYVLGHEPFALWSPISFGSSGWIWAALYASEFILLLLSAVTSSANLTGTLPLAWAPVCLKGDAVPFGWWPVPMLLHVFLHLSWVHLSKDFLFFSVTNASWWVCCKTFAFIFMKASLDWRLWQQYVYLFNVRF